MYKNVIGTNAGIVWRAMTSDRSWTYEELKEETGLSDKELWTAIGWLARENQIEFDSSTEEERIYSVPKPGGPARNRVARQQP